ncbi:hypothetical protein [Allokutzneria albata]|uniref:Uncharacterized protein n=1 Tax=Allokutzneria albata TaxID=211114 RepID=A0A1G9S9E9_ALLAB|nr:hypothetical protein [Allokutzneria albata]SDM31415.1 hypothetical protein SAMN04489726_0945 [Allokutzneria albata]
MTLHYTVRTSPTPLPAGQDDAAVQVTVRNTGAEPVTCEAITLTVPVGPGPDALTTAPEAIRAGTDARWAVAHRGDGVFEATPTDAAELGPGAELTITLDGIDVGAAPGTTSVEVGHTLRIGTRTHTAIARTTRLPKTAVRAVLEDFRPDRAAVGNGETVTLTWKCTEGPDFTLFYGSEQVVVNDYIDHGNGEWVSPPLHTATAFMLLATTADTSYGLTTAVTVDVPDLDVGHLDVNGTVRLFGQVQEIGGGTEPLTATYLADTDGVISGYIKTTEADKPAYLTVGVTPPGLRRQRFAVQSWDARGGGDNQEASLLVPVPKGSAVNVAQTGDSGFTASLTWFPFGSGPLREV